MNIGSVDHTGLLGHCVDFGLDLGMVFSIFIFIIAIKHHAQNNFDTERMYLSLKFWITFHHWSMSKHELEGRPAYYST